MISGELDKMIPDGIIEYVLGYFGEPPKEMDPKVVGRINGIPKAQRMRDRELPQPSIEEIREEPGPAKEISEEELLLRYASGNKDVDAVLASSSAPKHPKSPAVLSGGPYRGVA